MLCSFTSTRFEPPFLDSRKCTLLLRLLLRRISRCLGGPGFAYDRQWHPSDQKFKWLIDPELGLHDEYCLGSCEYEAGYSLRFTRRFDRFDPKLSLDLRGQAGHEHEHLAGYLTPSTMALDKPSMKRLILLCDGALEDADTQKDPARYTNIAKLARGLKDLDPRS